MEYALVEISRNRWIVAERVGPIGPYRACTKPALRDIAESIYDDLRILGRDKVQLKFEYLMIY